MIWLSVKRDFYIEISPVQITKNSTYEHVGFSRGLPLPHLKNDLFINALKTLKNTLRLI